MTRRAALALLLWGCGSVGGSSGGGVEVVRLAHRARGPEVSVAESLLDRYRNLNPGLQVAQLAAATNAGYRERLFKSLSTGTPPDAFLLDHGDVPAAIERGWLLDLAPYLSRAGVDQEAFNPAVLAIFRRGSALYALPRGYSPVVYPIPRTTGRGTTSSASPGCSRATTTATARSTSGGRRSSAVSQPGCRGSGRGAVTSCAPTDGAPGVASTPRPRSRRCAGTRGG